LDRPKTWSGSWAFWINLIDKRLQTSTSLDHLKTCLIIILLMLTGFCASARDRQQADSLAINAEKPVHSPHKASIYSAIMPGLGQIYNKKYWKVPLVYGGFAALIYSIDWNNDYFVLYKQAYADISDDDPNTNSFLDLNIEGNWDFTNESQVQQFATRLKNAKEVARRNRDLLIISTAAFYAINIIDATVDAHFFNFDISDDLTMNWAPGPMYCGNKPIAGVRVNIQF